MKRGTKKAYRRLKKGERLPINKLVSEIKEIRKKIGDQILKTNMDRVFKFS